MPRDRAKRWVFTWNNYTPENVAHLQEINCKYIGWGYETAPSTGTPHLQGFVYFHKQLRWKAVMAIMGNPSFVEVMEGTVEDNIAYCTKGPGEFWQSGPPPTEKKKTEFKDILKMTLKEADEVMREEHTWQSGSSNWKRLRSSMIKHYIGEMEVLWFYGPTGTGKTRCAVEEHNGELIEFDGKFFDYKGGADCVVLDEIDKLEKPIPMGTMLRLLDRYKYSLRVLGDYVPRDFKKIIITSTNHPEVVYSQSHCEQLLRRITKIVEFN
ncbi:nonstructural protein 1 [Penaeus monodon circovirus VN11]|uniref:nonstructural protein 1 n=1 Tax=Penaeus monodon circovirus VN11 TaxID=1419711 RepID=UPI0003C75929|nr:nonstructural protein 1 [Penaeus monodon circovirus VN11]AHA36869.1 nonstructural protein 1 [Penaeus monodon circovirus VN11]